MRGAPTRFQDFLRPTPPELRAYESLFMRGIAPPTRAQAETLRVALGQRDPLADQWVDFADQNLKPQAARAWVEAALDEGVEQLDQVPEQLKSLFTQVERVPLWLDQSLLGLARDTVRRSGPLGNWLLVNVALMGGYRYEGVIRPLIFTGRLTSSAPKRLADTTDFVQAILSRGGLQRGGRGFKAALQVRLLHAHIRLHLSRSPDWYEARWGAPINQADMLSTLLLFSLSFLVTSRVMGLTFTEREAYSVIHLWRYVGYLMGIEEHLLPSTEEEARRTFYLVGKTQTLAGPEAARLGRALHEVPLLYARTGTSRLGARLSMRLRAAISQLFLGDEALEHLGIPRTRLKYLLMAMIPLVHVADRCRAGLPGLNLIFTGLGGAWQDHYTRSILQRSRE
ncbi:MAG: oxygenase MpaB family protein [Myxococcota bacterium]|nr:oxygenase MpaB family protein [Myxococcota bacterium]